MNPSLHTKHFGFKNRCFDDNGVIEWEELPSLSDSLAQRLGHLGSCAQEAAHPTARRFASASKPWDATLPAALDTEVTSEPFHETLKGLVTREVCEPDVFRHFFGALFAGR